MNALANDKILQIQRMAQRVIAAQAGDRAAFGELFVQYEKSIYAVALRRTGDATEAQELVQDVFMQAMQKIDQLRTPEAFGGWLRQITVRMAINRMTRRKVAFATEPEVLQATVLGNGTPDQALLAKEREAQVRAGMARLREMDRDTLEAFYVQGQSLAEMADTFEAPIGTIKRRLHVARKRLAMEVEELASV
jgi:RNA polymerase sigma-70 factor (ECF subfamily)